METHGLPKSAAPHIEEAPRIETHPHAPAPARPAWYRRPFLILSAVVALGLAGLGVYVLVNTGYETTDDAQVEADVVPLAPRVDGTVRRVAVAQNQAVKKGDVILELDDADLKARVAQAEADLATAEAQQQVAESQEHVTEAGARGGLQTAKASVTSASAEARMSDAQVQSAEAAEKKAAADVRKNEANLARIKELAASGAVARKDLDDAQADYDAAVAAVGQAEADLTAARESQQAAASRVVEEQGKLGASTPVEAQIAVARAQATLAAARVRSAAQTLELARLQLTYATVTAPDDGTVSNLTVNAGQLLAANQPIGDLVRNDSYVVANFKETQIGKMRPGNPVTVKVDAYPGRRFDAVVHSLSMGTGARFSLLPPDNATGNFVKVVQRVPVRIEWTKAPEVSLAAGLSVDVRVKVK